MTLSSYPNTVDLIARFGDDFTSAMFERRRCRDCGGRMKIAGGMFVKRLQEPPAISHRIVMPARAEQPSF
jgi:hypothetical protein